MEAVLPKEVVAHLAGLMDSEGKTLAVLGRALSTIRQSPTMSRQRGEIRRRQLPPPGIVLRRLQECGFPHTLRVTIGTEKENRAVLDALTTFMGANSELGR